MKERTLGNRKLPWFWIALLLLVLVNACVVGTLLSHLNRSLTQYESETSGAALRAYIAAVQEGNFSRILADSGFSPTALNTSDDYIAVVKDLFGGIESPSFRKTSAKGEEGWEQYMVYDGEEEAGTVWITPSSGDNASLWSIRCDYDLYEGYTVTVPQHLEVHLNGRQLTPYNCTIEMLSIPAYGSLVQADRPVRMKYTTPPTIYAQEITVRLPEGECTLFPAEDGDPSKLEGWELLSPETEAAYTALITEAAKTYAAFVTNDAEFSELSGYLLPGTSFYNSVRTFDRQWYVPHTSYGFENLTVSGITAWSADSFSGNIRFDYIIYTGHKSYPYPTAYHMPFVRVDGQWKLVQIQVQ